MILTWQRSGRLSPQHIKQTRRLHQATSFECHNEVAFTFFNGDRDKIDAILADGGRLLGPADPAYPSVYTVVAVPLALVAARVAAGERLWGGSPHGGASPWRTEDDEGNYLVLGR